MRNLKFSLIVPVACSMSVAHATFLVPGSDRFGLSPSVTVPTMTYTGLCNYSWSNTLMTSIDASGNTLTVAGQLIYNWNIVSANVDYLAIEWHLWNAAADVNPLFTGTVNYQANLSGFHEHPKRGLSCLI